MDFLITIIVASKEGHMIGRERHPESKSGNSLDSGHYLGQISYDQEKTYIREYVSQQESVSGIINADIGVPSQSNFHFSPHELNFIGDDDDCN